MFPRGCLELASQNGKCREPLCDTECFAVLFVSESDLLHKNVQDVYT